MGAKRAQRAPKARPGVSQSRQRGQAAADTCSGVSGGRSEVAPLHAVLQHLLCGPPFHSGPCRPLQASVQTQTRAPFLPQGLRPGLGESGASDRRDGRPPPPPQCCDFIRVLSGALSPRLLGRCPGRLIRGQQEGAHGVCGAGPAPPSCPPACHVAPLRACRHPGSFEVIWTARQKVGSLLLHAGGLGASFIHSFAH